MPTDKMTLMATLNSNGKWLAFAAGGLAIAFLAWMVWQQVQPVDEQEREAAQHFRALGAKKIVSDPSTRGVVELDLYECGVRDSDLSSLRPLKNLRILVLDLNLITDAELKVLAALPKLEVLSLFKTKITDEGLKDISKLTWLKELYLNDTAITDAGLKYLANMKGLQLLHVKATKISSTGLQALRVALPECPEIKGGKD